MNERMGFVERVIIISDLIELMVKGIFVGRNICSAHVPVPAGLSAFCSRRRSGESSVEVARELRQGL